MLNTINNILKITTFILNLIVIAIAVRTIIINRRNRGN